MPPRAIWTGSISFGLVNVPVRMYSAIDEHDLHFHFIHEPDQSRIGYQKICKAEGEPVDDDEIVKAFEFEPGEFVVMTDEDFQAVKTEGVRTIDVQDFVPYEEIDPIYFERTYYLGPQANAEKVYALMTQAMEQSGLAAIVKYVMRDKQQLGCLRVRDGVITLEKMYFADEIRPTDGIAPDGAKVDKRELEMAGTLIEQFTGRFEPAKYEDTYRTALCDIIRAKRKGKTIKAAPAPVAEEPTDLLAALRASVEAVQKRRASNGGAKPKPKSRATAKSGGGRKTKSKTAS